MSYKFQEHLEQEKIDQIKITCMGHVKVQCVRYGQCFNLKHSKSELTSSIECEEARIGPCLSQRPCPVPVWCPAVFTGGC